MNEINRWLTYSAEDLGQEIARTVTGMIKAKTATLEADAALLRAKLADAERKLAECVAALDDEHAGRAPGTTTPDYERETIRDELDETTDRAEVRGSLHRGDES